MSPGAPGDAHHGRRGNHMNRSRLMLLPAIAAVVAWPLLAGSPATATQGNSYGATLSALNHATGSGMLSLTLNGNQATITEHWSGLAASFGGAAYPHVQHIHIGAMGTCPTMAADANGDGV